MKEGDICLSQKCSACCQDVRIRLTSEEHDFMVEGGATLQRVDAAPASLWGYDSCVPSEPKDGKRTYIMDGPCGYLGIDGKCTVYEHPQKPEPCGKTRPVGPGCTSARKEQGLIPLSDILPMVIFELGHE